MLILATKFKNAMKKETTEMDLEFSIKNISVNGQKRGCSGFVRNKANGSVVYVTTEEPCLSTLHYMYRYADNEKDYKGYHNRWANTLPELIEGIHQCLKKTPQEAKDFRV